MRQVLQRPNKGKTIGESGDTRGGGGVPPRCLLRGLRMRQGMSLRHGLGWFGPMIALLRCVPTVVSPSPTGATTGKRRKPSRLEKEKKGRVVQATLGPRANQQYGALPHDTSYGSARAVRWLKARLGNKKSRSAPNGAKTGRACVSG